jgi:anti-anti-sigma regulatory factor
MPTPFAIAMDTGSDPVKLIMVGELDTASATELETAFQYLLRAHDAANIRIDLTALEFCDSGGWHALERCMDEGAELHGSPPCLRRLFYLIKHAHLLPPEVHELRGLEAAVRPLPSGAPAFAASLRQRAA